MLSNRICMLVSSTHSGKNDEAPPPVTGAVRTRSFSTYGSLALRINRILLKRKPSHLRSPGQPAQTKNRQHAGLLVQKNTQEPE